MKRLTGLLILLQACSLANVSPPVSQGPQARPAPAASATPVGSQISAQASANGKYETLLKKVPCPSDKNQYGNFADTGYYDANRYCGQQAPAGYWVWTSPDWYIWKQEAATASPTAPATPASGAALPAPNARNSYQGKYKTLLQTINCPAERSKDEKQYGTYADAGYFAAVNYCGQSVPAGYWVYSAPNWYVWSEKDLAAIGFEALSKEVRLQKQTLTLRIEYAKANKVWAQENLDHVAAAITSMEQRTGIPYPGVNPYTIEETPNLRLLGLAGPSGMKLISPPKGSPWTFLHETVHIWNASQTPTWVIEGQANYLSYLMMLELNYGFIGDETYPSYIKEWREIQGTPEDLPLDENYNQLPQGKAMAWWAMIHELFGPDFTREIFVKLNQQKKLSTAEIESLLREAAGKDPAPLLDGWIRKGRYKVKQTSDFGPVRFPLPGAWP